MRKSLALAAVIFPAVCALAQQPGRVDWALTLEPAAAPPGATVQARLEAKLAPGWHLYSGTTAGAIPLTIKPAEGVVEGVRLFQAPPKRAFDPNFNLETETYEGAAVFWLQAKLKSDAAAGAAELKLNLRYQTCDDKVCIPGRATLTAPLTVDPAKTAAIPVVPAGFTEAAAPSSGTPVSRTPPAPSSQDIGAFLLIAFGFGLAAIFTPCVFPMIPITVSFFLNRQSGTRRDSIFQALIFCLGIVVLFSGLGLLITAVLGPFGVVQMGSNPWVNGFIALVFLVFGLSLLGAFEITIPSSVLTRLDRASQGGGTLGTLLMGLTFSLTAFACVGPFVGTLLAASVAGGGLRPLAGMASFATGLALPFFLLALFPSYLKRLPKSGGWMARVKVVMAFVILAAMLKYLSSLDQVLQWNLLTRERFLAAWIVLFAMPGLYLLGFLPLEGVKRDDRIGLGRLLPGIAFLIFSISLVPGMFGGRLGELDAYVPLASGTAAPGGSGGETGGVAWMKNSYREALDQARRENKRVFVSFTGYACTNCHWMKANMFTRPEIAAAMREFVAVELYTDGTDADSQANQELQQTRFATVAIPYYAILDPDERVVASYPGLTKSGPEFLAFLTKGRATPAAPATTNPLAGATITTLDGGAFDVAALDGKPAIVNFWATWCVPCIEEIPSFNKLHESLAGKVAVLGISMDEEGAQKVVPFLKKHPMKYPVAIGSESVAEHFKVEQLPVTLVFDRTGKQVARFEGYTDEATLDDAVRKAL
ncbi:MAG TPA: cytochrome c biogenesis protein CcdA [Bryobacteraceae bacterium]|nr:cytochrome c biogenesis protein CcdA [Bryobacteraceae bacterium]